MRFQKIKLISQHTFQNLRKASSTKWLVGLFNGLLFFALIAAFAYQQQQQHTVEHYSADVRERWESSPDKHPHRMAHYGYVAFRQKYPLSFFDYGLDSYVGNVVFLEAHRQNSVNFSEASLSNGLVRFGEISAALILQLLVPLLIFFWGFGLIAGERETGTLRLILSQGVSWSELIMGKSLGLFALSLLLFVPTILLALILLFVGDFTTDGLLSYGTLSISYLAYLFIMSLLAVWVSAKSQTSKNALIQLIGCWLFFTLLLPKLSQVAGQVFVPTPSQIEFDTVVEHELIKLGDSHNPDDPHYQAIKDSVLAANNVSSVKELDFNYSGLIMREGEKLSTEVYRRHQAELMEQYQRQQNIVGWTAFLNPYIAMKNVSMALSGTDFHAFRNFQNQSEAYRYNLAQTMNNWQIKFIANNTSSSTKGAVLDKQFWKDFADFEHEQLSFATILGNEKMSLLALVLWLGGLLFLVRFSTGGLKAF
ncbi:MAG: DUF3526 domain-containing protein [Bacteroidota bacterium]